MEYDIPLLNVLLYAFSFLVILTGLACLFRSFRNLPWRSTEPCRQRLGSEKGKWVAVLLALAIVSGVVLALFLSLSWTRGDDWRDIFCRGSALSSRIPNALGYYLSYVSRIGDIFIWLIGQSFGRLEANIATAIAAAAAPFALFRLCRCPGTDIWSARGSAFYLFAFCLCLTGVCMEPWNSYRCWAVVINYLIPTLATVYFLSHCRTDSRTDKDSKIRCIFLFALGIFCGWGTECGDVILIPSLVAFGLYCHYRKQAWTTSLSFGVLGTWLGAALLFASPALQARSDAARNNIPFRVADLSPEQLQGFFSHLNWETANLLKGTGGVIFIGDFSFADKLRFFPLLLERFWNCCHIGVIALVILVFLTLLYNKEDKLKNLAVAAGGLLISFTMASSYLASCIPWETSFLPPCFVIVGTCCYLFLRLPSKRIAVWVPAIAIVTYALSVFVPTGIEAWEYKKYELAQYDEIARQAKNGCTHIVLPYPYEQEPQNRMGLISPNHISEDSSKNKWIKEVLNQRVSGEIQSVRCLPRSQHTGNSRE